MLRTTNKESLKRFAHSSSSTSEEEERQAKSAAAPTLVIMPIRMGEKVNFRSGWLERERISGPEYSIGALCHTLSRCLVDFFLSVVHLLSWTVPQLDRFHTGTGRL